MQKNRYLSEKTFPYYTQGLSYLMVLYSLSPQSPAVFLLIISSISFNIVKWRFKLPSTIFYLEFVVLIILETFIPGSLLLIIPPLFIFKRWPVPEAALIAFVPFLIQNVTFQYYLFLGIALFAVTFQLLWKNDAEQAELNNDRLRKRLYLQEGRMDTLLNDQQEISRLAALHERDRIAQKLHDDLGHELTGAHLSLKAYKTIVNRNDSVMEAFDKGFERLERSLQALRQTVEATRPLESFGFETFKNMVDQFESPRPVLEVKGNVWSITPKAWYAVNSVLKEALTNITKHASPDEVHIRLEQTDAITQLKISNDGLTSQTNNAGHGLRFMRRRIEALNGMVSITKTNWFTIIVTLPREEHDA